MKRIIVLFVFVCFAKIDVAQVYQPFPTDSAVWRQISLQTFSPVMEMWDFNYYIDGDTTVLGQTYHKIYRTGAYSYYQETWSFYYEIVFGPNADNRGYVGGIREDGTKRVYFLKAPFFVGDPDSLEQLLYDFNLNVGDTLPVAYNNTSWVSGENVVSSIDSILIDTSYHKRFNISTSLETNYVSIIEGVGSTYGLLEMLQPGFEHLDRLQCFTRNGTVKYSNFLYTFSGGPAPACELPSLVGISEQKKNAETSIFPNPTNGIINLKTPFSEKTQIEIFDVLGKRVYRSEQSAFEFTIDLSQQPKGVYFLKAGSGNKINKTRKIVLE